MFASNNHILISHIGKSCSPLRGFEKEDSLTVYFSNYPSSLIIRQHAVMKGVTLEAIIRNVKTHKDGLEIEAYDNYFISPSPIAVWYHKRHYYVFQLELQHYDVNFMHNQCRHIFVATKVLKFEDENQEFMFNMIKSNKMTSTQILNNFDLVEL